MILILGQSTLAKELQILLPTAQIVGKPDYDFSVQQDCDRVLSQYEPTVVINTHALNQHNDPWQILTVNYTSVVYLTLGWYDKMHQGHIINISSTSTYWPSYPGIDTGRLCYNVSKESLSMFGRHFNRAIVDHDHKPTVTTIELGKFNSKFNDFSGGMSVSKAAGMVKNCIDNPVTSMSVIK